MNNAVNDGYQVREDECSGDEAEDQHAAHFNRRRGDFLQCHDHPQQPRDDGRGDERRAEREAADPKGADAGKGEDERRTAEREVENAVVEANSFKLVLAKQRFNDGDFDSRVSQLNSRALKLPP